MSSSQDARESKPEEDGASEDSAVPDLNLLDEEDEEIEEIVGGGAKNPKERRAMPHEDPGEGTQDRPVKKEPKMPAMSWSNLKDINAQWFSAVGKELPLDRLAWDVRVEYGQARPLDDAHVKKVFDSLQVRPPREPVKVTVWENEGDKKFYILSGQHISKAVLWSREQREKTGLSLEPWHHVVRADVLKFMTPLSVRKTVSGADNASTRVQRETTVSECLKNLIRDHSADDMHDKVARAVEQSGLNVDLSNPV